MGMIMIVTALILNEPAKVSEAEPVSEGQRRAAKGNEGKTRATIEVLHRFSEVSHYSELKTSPKN